MYTGDTFRTRATCERQLILSRVRAQYRPPVNEHLCTPHTYHSYLLASSALDERALGNDLHRVRPGSVQAGDLVAVREPALLRQEENGDNDLHRATGYVYGRLCMSANEHRGGAKSLLS